MKKLRGKFDLESRSRIPNQGPSEPLTIHQLMTLSGLDIRRHGVRRHRKSLYVASILAATVLNHPLIISVHVFILDR